MNQKFLIHHFNFNTMDNRHPSITEFQHLENEDVLAAKWTTSVQFVDLVYHNKILGTLEIKSGLWKMKVTELNLTQTKTMKLQIMIIFSEFIMQSYYIILDVEKTSTGFLLDLGSSTYIINRNIQCDIVSIEVPNL